MKLMNTKIAIFILTVGLLAACVSQPVEAPASPPTNEIVIPPQAATSASTTLVATIQETTVPTTTAPITGVSFSHDVLPILQSRCVNCHGGDRVEKGLTLKTYTDLMAGSQNGPVVTAGDSLNSLLVGLIANQKMPKRGPKLTPPQVQLITDWVNQGALNN